MPKPNDKSPVMNWRMAVIATAVLVLPISAYVLFQNSYGLLEPTSIAILAASFGLVILISGLAYELRLFPWQIANDSSSKKAGSRRALVEQCLLYAFVPFLTSEAIVFFNVATDWHTHLPNALALELPVAILLSTLITYLLEILVYKRASRLSFKQTALSAGPVLNTNLIAWLMIVLVPPVQIGVCYPCLGAEIDDLDTFRLLVTPAIALSTIALAKATFSLTPLWRKSPLVVLKGAAIFAALTLFIGVATLVCQPATGHLLSAFVTAMKGDVPKVIEECDAALKCDPKMTAAYRMRANSNFIMGQYIAAKVDCTRAINVDPKDADAYYIRAWSMFHTGELKPALNDANTAIEVKPVYPNYLVRNAIYMGLQQYVKALADGNELVKLRPAASFAYVCRANARFHGGQIDQAMSDLTMAIKLNRFNKSAYMLRTQIYDLTGLTNKAKADRDILDQLNKMGQPQSEQTKAAQPKVDPQKPAGPNPQTSK